MTEPVVWPEGDGAPRSPRFDDTYFSREGGLEESRTVFLDGCGLPDAWTGRRGFTVAELGFGTGLNILALLDLWRRTRPSPGARLSILSIEAFPIGLADARRALSAWPDLAELAAALFEGWPDGRRGWRRIEWPALGATLDLAVEEVGEALVGWRGRADAWFLDGFAPSRNPEMWRDEVLDLVAARSAPGARLATFTVAGAVRRGLAERGFTVERRPGFGRKKERLEARLPSVAMETPSPRVAILGAGIAGASLKRAFDRLGVEAQVFDPAGPGAGASGNAAALVTPRLDAGLGPIAELHAQAFARAVALYRSEAPDAIIATGALQLQTSDRDGGRFDKIAVWDGFAAGALARLTADGVAEKLDEWADRGGLAFRDAMVVEPAAILTAWLGEVDRRAPEPGEADVTVIAMGHAGAARLPGLPLRPVRGQTSIADHRFTGFPAAWGGYAIPTRTGTLFGATHDRDDTATEVRAVDHARNLDELAKGRPALTERLAGLPLDGRAAIRAATPDHLPLAGAVPSMEGAFVLAGLGGRGFTLAPLLAEAVAAMVVGAPEPVPDRLLRLVDPGRYGP